MILHVNVCMCVRAGSRRRSRKKEQEGYEEERREREREKWGLTMCHSACVEVRRHLPGVDLLLLPLVFKSNSGHKAYRECAFIAGPFHWPLCKFLCPFMRWTLGHFYFTTTINSAPAKKAVPHSLMLSCLLWMNIQKGDCWGDMASLLHAILYFSTLRPMDSGEIVFPP